MAPGTGLTVQQRKFLTVAVREKYLLENFYLTGGTALSSWYLHHRESFDLDFFSKKSFDTDRLEAWIVNNKDQFGYQFYHHDEDFGFSTFILRYKDDSILKVDFNHYCPTILKKPTIWQGLRVDSLYDIAVNKVKTISTLPRGRDYIDFFLIIKKTGWSEAKLRVDANKKFMSETDILSVIKNYLKVTELIDTPKLLIDFDRKEMENFYNNLANGLRKVVLA